ncbi:MAG: hypothetical protein IKQ36_02045 [Clostridia bacterium]|nr:hypothetical protein [Clostridia bacterium]
MNIDEIKKELKPREGLMSETLEKAAAEKPGRSYLKYAAIVSACAALFIGAVVLVLTRKGQPERDAASDTSPKPTLAPKATLAPKSTPETEVSSDGELVEGANIFMFIDEASDIFEGVCETKSLNNERMTTDMEFTVTNVIRGGLKKGDKVPVRTNFGDEIEAGGQYLVLSEPMGSVFEGKELFYYSGAIFGRSVMTQLQKDLEDIRSMEYDELVALVSEYAEESVYTGEGAGRGFWCASEDIGEILDFSDCAVKVRVKEIKLNAVSDRTSYLCTVIESYKGEARGNIHVVSFKNSLKTGEEYVLLLTHSGGELYAVSSPHSVLDPASAEAEPVLNAGKTA